MLYGIYFKRQGEGAIEYLFSLIIFIGIGTIIISMMQRILFDCEFIIFIKEIIVFSLIILLSALAIDELELWMIPNGIAVLGHVVGNIFGKILKVYIDANS